MDPTEPLIPCLADSTLGYSPSLTPHPTGCIDHPSVHSHGPLHCPPCPRRSCWAEIVFLFPSPLFRPRVPGVQLIGPRRRQSLALVHGGYFGCVSAWSGGRKGGKKQVFEEFLPVAKISLLLTISWNNTLEQMKWQSAKDYVLPETRPRGRVPSALL